MTNNESGKDMMKPFEKLDKFSGQDIRRWQKMMHFYLTNLKLVYVLSTPCLEAVENETLEQTRARSKWENSDYICHGHILNDTRPVMEQYHELQRMLGQLALYGMKMDESISSIRDMEKASVGGTKTMVGSSVNMMEEGETFKAGKGKRKSQGNNNKGSDKKPKLACWKCGKPGHLKRECRSGKGKGKGKNDAGTSRSKDPENQAVSFLVPCDHSIETYYVSIISEAFYVQDDDTSW
uniref:uncharacterized protein LOC122607168 n=1 Tax=Erigeron canadensis TaxID=72917 RepID=UPI001CB9270E|nr:uncharacterized protein LOC122607168 [Erigeron canadensis]